jgi:hypothetical protein
MNTKQPVTLIISSIVDVNIFHFFALEIHAVWEHIKREQQQRCIVYLQNFQNNGVHYWRKDLLNCIVPTFTSIQEVHDYCEKENLMVNNAPNLTYHGWIIDPWSFVKYTPDPSYLQFADKVKDKLGSSNKVGVYATLVKRTKSRILFDHVTKDLFEHVFIQTCQEKNIPWKVVDFDNLTLQEQAEALADTKVMLSCHGAGNTNVFLLPDNGHLIEINFRKHWYCDPVCDPHFHGNLPSTSKCNGKLTWRPYFHKADYHNLAKFFGKQYTELNSEYTEEYVDRNPINVMRVYIDSKHVMHHVVSHVMT